MLRLIQSAVCICFSELVDLLNQVERRFAVIVTNAAIGPGVQKRDDVRGFSSTCRPVQRSQPIPVPSLKLCAAFQKRDDIGGFPSIRS